MNKVFEQIYTKVWEEIFPGINPIDQAAFKKLYCNDIPLPQAYPAISGNISVYSSPEYGYKKFITKEESEKRMNTDNFMEPKTDIASFADVLKLMEKRATFRGNRALNSDVTEESDDIYSSSYIYNSAHVYSSQKLMYCFNMKTSEYLLASKGSGDCSFGIRVIDSGSISNSFDVGWSSKSANSYFSYSVVDVRDCMFCFHIMSKQYCIANMQFSQEEYKKLKEKILKEYFDQLTKPDAFVSINQL